MSVRAYKLIEIKHEKQATFNCWHDQRIMDIANLENYNDGGLIMIEQEAAEELAEELQSEIAKMKDGEEKDDLKITLQNVKEIIKESKADGYAEYYCF